MTVFVVDPRLLDLIELDAKAERIATGFVFTEGPVWNHRDQSLTFVDHALRVPEAEAIYRWTAADGVRLYRKPAENANGNTLDRQGRLVSCLSGSKRIALTNADGSVEVLADNYMGRPFNRPNDLICAPNGDVIFTDPFLRRPDGPDGRSAVYRISAVDRSVRLLNDTLITPNGLAMSSDGSVLFVADTRAKDVKRFDVLEDGNLSNERVFCELKPAGLPLATVEFLRRQVPDDATVRRPDGMKLDSMGNLYVAPNCNEGIWVFDPQGQLLGFIGMGEEPSLFVEGLGGPANLAWGDEDWRSLYVTAVTSVYRVRLKISGQPV